MQEPHECEQPDAWNSALFLATFVSHVTVVQVLLEHETNPPQRTSEHKTGLYASVLHARKGRGELLNLLGAGARKAEVVLGMVKAILHELVNKRNVEGRIANLKKEPYEWNATVPADYVNSATPSAAKGDLPQAAAAPAPAGNYGVAAKSDEAVYKLKGGKDKDENKDKDVNGKSDVQVETPEALAI